MQRGDKFEPSQEAKDAQEFSEQLDRLLQTPSTGPVFGPIWPDPSEDPWSVTLPDVVRHEDDYERGGNGQYPSAQGQQDASSTKSRARGGAPPPSQE